MEKSPKKIWIPLVFIIILIIALGLYFFYPSLIKKPTEDKFPKDIGLPEVKEAKPGPPALPAEEKEEVLPIPAVGLNESDEVVQKYAQELSSHKQFREWIRAKNLIRLIAAVIVNIAEGESPREHLKFLAPQKSFLAKKEGKKIYIHSDSYHRYDFMVNVFSSLDAQKTARLYNSLKALFQEAYKELGHPQGDFHEVLIEAIVMILKMPQIKGKILLEEEEKGISYYFVDDNLEELNDFHKHLVRMGPENVTRIQIKVREIAQALKLPAEKLPPPKIYVSKEY